MLKYFEFIPLASARVRLRAADLKYIFPEIYLRQIFDNFKHVVVHDIYIYVIIFHHISIDTFGGLFSSVRRWRRVRYVKI